ncbi:MAG: tRNA lysidine(34) synthetase TilS [Rhodobacteraceae bacterium]|nr:tRNA lysidine(34) synthetase TilS [Paracoccaceae bacterium]
MTAAALARLVRDGLAGHADGTIGVAVSGGGDSTALLILLDDWRREGGPGLAAVTVDHGLRPEAAAEAAGVAQLCARLGVPHDILRWHWDGQGNLPDAARRGRRDLIAGWARERGIASVALAHTADDQAETVLMRLARGSGVDGLSAMAAARRAGGIVWLRPLLAARRAVLRRFLADRGAGWAEDPTNDDPAYDRVKARAMLEALAPLGVTVEGLCATAGWMRLAREVLEGAAADLARRAVRADRGDVLIARDDLLAAPAETRQRLMAGMLMWVAGLAYRPRHEALERLMRAVAAGRAATLAGCHVAVARGQVRLTREARAVEGLVAPPGIPWDGRWVLCGPFAAGMEVRALGAAGLAACPDWRASGLPRRSLLASPAVWQGARLVAAPLAGHGRGWTAELGPGRDDPITSLVTH